MGREVRFNRLEDVNIKERAMELFEEAPWIGGEQVIFAWLSAAPGHSKDMQYCYARGLKGEEIEQLVEDFLEVVNKNLTPSRKWIAMGYMVKTNEPSSPFSPVQEE